MKKINICKVLTTLFLPLLFVTACDKTEETAPTIRIKAPEAEAEFDLNKGNVRFEWQVTGVITGGYTLTLATDPNMTDTKAYQTPATSFSKEIPAEDIDLLLKGWGYKANERALIYWKVEATEGNAVASALQSVNIRRLEAEAVEIALIAPARNMLIDLGSVNSVKFEWDGDSEISAYALEISQSEDGDKLAVSVGVDLSAISGNSVTITSENLTAMITSLGLTAPVSTFYWKVRSKTSTAPGVSESRKLRLIKIGAEGLSPVSNLKAIPGNRRAKLTWDVDDPRITQVIVSWNGGSRNITVGENDDAMEIVIENLAKGACNFTITTEDEIGTKSEEVTVNADVYDDSFTAGLEARGLTLVSLTREGATLAFGETGNSGFLQSSTLKYTNTGSMEATREIANEGKIILTADDIMFGTTVTLESSYAPEAVVLDPFVLTASVYVPVYALMNKSLHAKVENIVKDHGALSGYGYNMMFDGSNTGAGNMWHTSGSDVNASGVSGSLVGDPILVTLDLGATANLSSLVIWGRDGGLADGGVTNPTVGVTDASYWAFGSYNPRKFEVWGSSAEPASVSNEGIWAADGTWKDSWTLLAECEIFRPSGCLVTSFVCEDLTQHPLAFPPNEADMLAAANGFEFSIPSGKPEVRYVRLVIKETWNYFKRKRISISELSFYAYTPEN
ncbi:MAG: SusE domain-containing protein [Bacteroidales bacterium]|jgi:hypothetical protein|nr:SusE domain-containing protein [Bacteroidales bacterium]